MKLVLESLATAQCPATKTLFLEDYTCTTQASETRLKTKSLAHRWVRSVIHPAAPLLAISTRGQGVARTAVNVCAATSAYGIVVGSRQSRRFRKTTRRRTMRIHPTCHAPFLMLRGRQLQQLLHRHELQGIGLNPRFPATTLSDTDNAQRGLQPVPGDIMGAATTGAKSAALRSTQGNAAGDPCIPDRLGETQSYRRSEAEADLQSRPILLHLQSLPILLPTHHHRRS
jgi:hypothetical protein